MAGLFLVSTRDPEFAAQAMAGARSQFGHHGFGPARTLAFPGWQLLHAPFIHGGPETLLVEGDDLVAVAGTLSFDGLFGTPALHKLLHEASLPVPDWQRLAGQFVVLVRKAGRCFLLTDYFGAFQLFHDPALRIFSTSLLAAAQALPRLSFDPQSIYEFVFNVFPIGDDGIFRELRRLGPDRLIELDEAGTRWHMLAKPLAAPDGKGRLADRVATQAALLRATVRPYVTAFGDHVQSPLSGGLDSRLLLATLRAEGCRPHVYVYGKPQNDDVAIARAIGNAEGFEVEVVEKPRYRAICPGQFAEQVARNFHEGDALITDGGLFDNGGNAAARDARQLNGTLAASGGCGEIYRNFFYLPDRPITASALIRSFYARYSRGDLTAAFDEPAFLAAVEAKIRAAIGHHGPGPLPRGLIEQVYPRVRCRAFFGREISLVGRHGAYLMPFYDHRVVSAAMTLPLGIKHAGRFEAALIAAIDPALARHPSAYGHDFLGAPGRSHRFAEWSTRIRPPWLRRRSYAIRRFLGPVSDDHGGLLSAGYLGRVIDLNLPVMRRWFRPDRISDSGVWRRIATLEYLAAYLGSRLDDSG